MLKYDPKWCSLLQLFAHEQKNTGTLNWELEDVSVGNPGDHEVLVDIGILMSSLPKRFHGIEYLEIVGHEGAVFVCIRAQNI